MKPLAMAGAFAFAGVVASCAIVWWAANQWDTFNDKWLFSGCILPVFGAIFGAWLFTPKESWPPGLTRRFPIAVTAGVFAGIGSYIGFALVSKTWNGGIGSAGSFFSCLFDPSQIPELSTQKSGGRATNSGVLVHAVICAAVGAIMPLFWLRGSSKS